MFIHRSAHPSLPLRVDPVALAPGSVRVRDILRAVMDSRDDHFGENGLRFWLVADPPGVAEVPAFPDTQVSVHYGQSVDVACRRGGQFHRGIAVHGDVDVIPALMPGVWEIKGRD